MDFAIPPILDYWFPDYCLRNFETPPFLDVAYLETAFKKSLREFILGIPPPLSPERSDLTENPPSDLWLILEALVIYLLKSFIGILAESRLLKELCRASFFSIGFAFSKSMAGYSMIIAGLLSSPLKLPCRSSSSSIYFKTIFILR